MICTVPRIPSPPITLAAGVGFVVEAVEVSLAAASLDLMDAAVLMVVADELLLWPVARHVANFC